MENICFSYFTIKGIGEACKVCRSPNDITLDNQFKRVIQLDHRSKDFGMRT